MDTGTVVIVVVVVFALLAIAGFQLYRKSARVRIWVGKSFGIEFEGENQAAEATPGGASRVNLGDRADIGGDVIGGDQTINIHAPPAAPEPITPLPELTLKLFCLEDRQRKAEIACDQPEHVPAGGQYVFGCALENTAESTIAKEIDITMTLWWQGDPPDRCPMISIPRQLQLDGWVVYEAYIGRVEDQPAVLKFEGPDRRCGFGQSIEWRGLGLRFAERMAGYVDIRYVVSSSPPPREPSGTLRIVMQ